MKKTTFSKKFTFLIISILVAVAAVIATTSSSKKQQDQAWSGSTYHKAIYSLPRNLDPIKMNDTASLLLSQLLYDGLLSFNFDLNFSGALAESWSLDSSSKIYTFKLKKNIRFHDGSAITPNDVIGSLTRAVSKESTVYKYYDCILGAEEYYSGKASSVKGLKLVDGDSISIELNYPFPPFLSVLAGATAKILPIDKISKDPNFFKNPIGSGAFKFISLKKETDDYGELMLARFDDYYGGMPKISRLHLIATEEKNAHELAKAGKVYDLANYPLSGDEDVFKYGKKIDSPVAATWIIGLNTRIAPFNDIKVRRAFKKSIDTEEFRKKFYFDSVPASGYIPIGLPGYIGEQTEHFSATKAATKKSISIAIPEVLSKSAEMIQFFNAGLEKQKWNAKFIPFGWDKLMEGYDKKTLQAFLVSMNMDYPDTEFLIRNFESSNPDNFSGIKNKELDIMIQQARANSDRTIRNYLYQQIVKKIEDLAVTVNLFHPRSHNWVSSCVKNFVPSILADYYIDYRVIEIDEKCDPKSASL